jgi:DNA-binding LacI/PurR family transcriptional regulator
MLSVVNRLPEVERHGFGLIGTGAGEYLDAIAPWLTRVEIPAREQGRAAIDLLFSLIDGATEQRGREIVLPMRLVERESTAPREALGIA